MNKNHSRNTRSQGQGSTHLTAIHVSDVGPRIMGAFAQALRHHQAGELGAAETRYREILGLDASHLDSLHLLGVLAHQMGRHREAFDLIGKAIGLNGQVPAFHNNMGLVLRALGRLQNAAAHFTRAIDLKADFTEAHKNFADVLREQGNIDDALAQYRLAMLLRPEAPEVYNNLGAILYEQGRSLEAIVQYERALALRPDYPEALNNLGNALQAHGNLKHAVERYRCALALLPTFAEAANNLASTLRRDGKLNEALTQYQRALCLRPDYAEARCNVGLALREAGRLEEALGHYRQALVLQPNSAETYNGIAVALREQEKLDEAVATYREALRLSPAYPEALNNLGVALGEQGLLDQAIEAYQRALAVKSDYPAALSNVGVALRHRGKLADAMAQLQRAIALEPDAEAFYCNIGEVLRDQGKLDEAVVQFHRAVQLRPTYANAHNNLGAALQLRPTYTNANNNLGAAPLSEQDALEQALAHHRLALEFDPGCARFHMDLGHTLRALGRLLEARHAYETAIKLAPQKPAFYLGLTTIKRFSPGDAELSELEKLATGAASLSTKDRVHLGFALGKVYEDIGDHQRSFRHLLEANTLERQQFVYDEAAMLNEFSRICEVFTPELMKEKSGLGDPSSVPIFIIGMPRSGTTLIEQILASHPEVFGAGELVNMPKAVASLADVRSSAFPQFVSSIEGEQLNRLGENYVTAVRALAPNAVRITDKMPHNFYFAGLIHLALPNARIIHARRDPVDTCLSCFSKLFSGEHAYAYDLAELGRYYRAYEGLMAHWRELLSEDVMLEVSYEDVIADVENQARRIITHCGLEWDEACLAFHNTQRPVRTASVVQVRQPIYHSSVGRGRAYEHLLEPLISALQGNTTSKSDTVITAKT